MPRSRFVVASPVRAARCTFSELSPEFPDILPAWARLLLSFPCLQAGLTPLHYAAYSGHLENVKTLLAMGADKNAKTNVRIPGDLQACCNRAESMSVT